jgi:dolichyl-phosphate beta-glucosyltransferase
MVIAIVVPCFNEEKRINISYWKSNVDKFVDCQWIFVNDGSTDNTRLILNQITGENVHHLDLPTNNGKGNAIRAGFNHVIDFPRTCAGMTSPSKLNFSRIGYMDSDGAFDLSDIQALFALTEEKIKLVPPYKVIIGSRVKLAGRQIDRSKIRHYLGRLIATFICLGWEKAPYDTQSGFKIFCLDSTFRDAVNAPFKTSWFFDIELILRLDTLHSVMIWEEPLMKWNEVGDSSITISTYFNIFRQIFTIRALVKRHSKKNTI